MKIWVINEGRYYDDFFYIQSIHSTKLCAEKTCRDDGFKFKDQIFENDKEQLYRKIEVEHLDCNFCTPRKRKEPK